MAARESLLESDLIPGDISRLFPIVDPSGSDSASFDEVLELLYLGGRSLAHSILMMIPEAWENHETMPEKLKDFYRFHASLMEPWDGPACVTFTDGKQIGAVLDRNGLRPSRYWVTDDGLVVLASEVGVLDIPQEKVIRKGRLQPGRMFLVDIQSGRIIEDEEIKQSLATNAPYGEWLHADSTRSVFPKLAAYMSMSSIALPIETINLLVASSVHFVVHIEVVRGQRRVSSIREVVDSDGSTIVSNEVVRNFNGEVGFGYPLREETRNLFEEFGFREEMLR